MRAAIRTFLAVAVLAWLIAALPATMVRGQGGPSALDHPGPTSVPASPGDECLVEIHDGSGPLPDGGTLCQTATDRLCTFNLQLCLNQPEAGCTPANFTKHSFHATGHCGPVRQLRVNSMGTDSVCGAFTGVDVRTRSNGKRPGKCTIRAEVRSAKVGARTDVDTVTLACMPRGSACPSTTTTTTPGATTTSTVAGATTTTTTTTTLGATTTTTLGPTTTTTLGATTTTTTLGATTSTLASTTTTTAPATTSTTSVATTTTTMLVTTTAPPTTTTTIAACNAIVPGQPISNTYQTASVTGPKICNQNATNAGKAFTACSSDTDCGGATTCQQPPFVTLGGLSQPTPLGSKTTFTVAEAAAPACEHAACIKCGALATCAGLPSCGGPGANNCNGHLSNQCCTTPGFTLPALFISAVNACTRLDQNGSGSGVVNTSMDGGGHNTGHNVVKKSGDTSHPDGGGAPCAYDSPADADTCSTADGDTKGLVFRTVGTGACQTGVPPAGSLCGADADGIHIRLSTPGLSTTWQTTSADCMNNGTFHSGTVLTQIQLNAEPSTAGAVGEFADHNADGCAIGTFGSQGLSIASPAGPISTVGTAAQKPVPYGGTGSRSAAIGIAFSAISGEGDIGFVAVTDTNGPTVVAASACDAAPINPPVGCPEQ